MNCLHLSIRSLTTIVKSYKGIVSHKKCAFLPQFLHELELHLNAFLHVVL